MSAVTVIYNKDNNPINRNVFNQVFSRLDYRGVNGNDIIYFNSIAIGHQHFWTTPEEIAERQPLHDKDRKITLAFDGRIDNRSELFKLACNEDMNSTVSDAKLIMELYITHGDKIFEKIVGPFLVVIYDDIKKELLLVRDPLGDRTIYYYNNNLVFIASSEEHSILEHPSVSRELNNISILKLLSEISLPDYGETFFKNIKELPPAHIIRITNYKIDFLKYWNITENQKIYSNKKLDELAEEYYYLLENSVIACLRSVDKPAVMMSGGIDSTSVAAFSAKNLEMYGFKPPITTISGVFNDLTGCDESNFINELTNKININAIKILCDDAYPLACQEYFFKNPNTPFDDSYRIMTDKIYEFAIENQNKILLTGHFADDLFYKGRYDYLLELLRNYKFSDFYSNITTIIKEKGLKEFIRDPAVRRLFGFYNKIIKSGRRNFNFVKLSDAALKSLEEIISENRSVTYPYLNLNSTKISNYETVNSYMKNIELRFPYRNIKLVQFVYNLPKYYLFNSVERKVIAKRALKKLLPSTILNRSDDISLRDLYVKGLPVIKNLLQRYNSNNSYIIYKMLNDVDFQNFNTSHSWEKDCYDSFIWFCISLELWSRKYGYSL